jgi:hypothetical protein
LVEAMLGFATPRGMAPLLSIQVSWPAWLVKLKFSPNICSFKVTSFVTSLILLVCKNVEIQKLALDLSAHEIN